MLKLGLLFTFQEKKIVPFSGEAGKDVHTVDEFIEEVERGMMQITIKGFGPRGG